MDTGPEIPLTYDLSLLEKSQRKWETSPGLRVVYHSLFREIARRLPSGPTLELGSGIGNLKEVIPSVVTTDLIKTRYVDMACSAYDIPFPVEGDKWGSIVAIDMLHHLCRPFDFFESASARLKTGGRIILIEPAATPFGCLFYKLFHPEPIRPGRINPPFEMAADEPDGSYANMGMGVALFQRHSLRTRETLSDLQLSLEELSFRDILAYPLSGGYSTPQLMPARLLRGILKIEHSLPHWLLRNMGLRMVIVLRRT